VNTHAHQESASRSQVGLAPMVFLSVCGSVKIHPNITLVSSPVKVELMRTLTQWFSEYAESHQNKTNKLLHFICVPLITLCVIGFAWELPQPEFMAKLTVINWATVLVALVLVFYFKLSTTLALGMSLLSVMVLLGLQRYDALFSTPIWLVSAVVFVLAWIGQFIGHYIEGKKPSFFKDLQFLLIGPLWILSFVYQKAGISLGK
jgi:uncharacterized membrane protein YGL010W